jgi:hypothetical protein
VKIGALELRSPFVRNQTNGTKPSTTEVGQTGTQIFSGQLSPVQDYNDALNPPQSYDVFDKMRLGDGTVAASLRVIKMPLLNSRWKLEPASDSAQDKEIAERLDHNLKHRMNVSWHAQLRQILLHLDYGNMPFEPVWKIEDGLVMLRKLAPRHPRTITKWLTDSKGGLAGVEQTTAPDFRPTEINVSKLVVFINELEGSNFHGISVLRPAYKAWTYVDGLERVEAIAIEKRGAGIDTGKLIGEGITDARRGDAERALQTIHGHQKMYMVEIDGQFEYRVQGIVGDVIDPNNAIQRHKLEIVRSMITEFLAMGAGSTGSLAMHKDKSSFAMMALGGIANNICETVDMHLIRPWVDYNWTVKEYPRLQYTHLDARPLAEFADSVLKFSQAGMKWTIDQENAARAMLDVPPLPESEFEEPEEPETEPEEPESLENMPVEQLRAVATLARRELKRRREGVMV